MREGFGAQSQAIVRWLSQTNLPIDAQQRREHDIALMFGSTKQDVRLSMDTCISCREGRQEDIDKQTVADPRTQTA